MVYPVPAKYIGTDNHNWHETGTYWSQWHTGTDFSAPCGTTVYAAHAGTIEIDTTQGSDLLVCHERRKELDDVGRVL